VSSPTVPPPGLRTRTVRSRWEGWAQVETPEQTHMSGDFEVKSRQGTSKVTAGPQADPRPVGFPLRSAALVPPVGRVPARECGRRGTPTGGRSPVAVPDHQASALARLD